MLRPDMPPLFGHTFTRVIFTKHETSHVTFRQKFFPKRSVLAAAKISGGVRRYRTCNSLALHRHHQAVFKDSSYLGRGLKRSKHSRRMRRYEACSSLALHCHHQAVFKDSSHWGRGLRSKIFRGMKRYEAYNNLVLHCYLQAVFKDSSH